MEGVEGLGEFERWVEGRLRRRWWKGWWGLKGRVEVRLGECGKRGMERVPLPLPLPVEVLEVEDRGREKGGWSSG